MNSSKLTKMVGTGVIALTLAFSSANLPAHAQTNNENNSAPALDTTPFQETRNDNNNLGWLGLVGLVGLLNLLRKRKDDDRPAVVEGGNRASMAYMDEHGAHPINPDRDNYPEQR